MPTLTNPQRPLTDLLTELEAAIRAGDRARATQLEQTILQRLATEAADHSAVERRVRALMAELEPAELDQPGARPRVRGVESFNVVRGAEAPADEGVVYPVWFGT